MCYSNQKCWQSRTKICNNWYKALCSSCDFIKLQNLQQLKTGFKITITLNKYRPKPILQTQNQYLNYVIDLSSQEVNKVFVLLFENDAHQISYKRYFLPTTVKKRPQCYDWWEKLFSSSSKNDLRTYESIQKIATGQGDDYTTGCSLDYNHFKDYYKIIATDLSKQQALDVDPKQK